MAAKLTKTSTPGVFKRDNRYAVTYRDGEGRQRWESARTYEDARRLRSTRAAAVADGSYQARTRERFSDFALAWVERYQGTARHGFADHTRNDYRRDLKAYAIPRLGRLRVEQITPRHIAEFVAWLCDEKAQERHLADATVRASSRPFARACARPCERA
jgi:integrase-like protein